MLVLWKNSEKCFKMYQVIGFRLRYDYVTKFNFYPQFCSRFNTTIKSSNLIHRCQQGRIFSLLLKFVHTDPWKPLKTKRIWRLYYILSLANFSTDYVQTWIQVKQKDVGYFCVSYYYSRINCNKRKGFLLS